MPHAIVALIGLWLLVEVFRHEIRRREVEMTLRDRKERVEACIAEIRGLLPAASPEDAAVEASPSAPEASLPPTTDSTVGPLVSQARALVEKSPETAVSTVQRLLARDSGSIVASR